MYRLKDRIMAINSIVANKNYFKIVAAGAGRVDFRPKRSTTWSESAAQHRGDLPPRPIAHHGLSQVTDSREPMAADASGDTFNELGAWHAAGSARARPLWLPSRRGGDAGLGSLLAAALARPALPQPPPPDRLATAAPLRSGAVRVLRQGRRRRRVRRDGAGVEGQRLLKDGLGQRVRPRRMAARQRECGSPFPPPRAGCPGRLGPALWWSSSHCSMAHRWTWCAAFPPLM